MQQHTSATTLAGIGWGLGAGILSAFLFSIPYVYATYYVPVMEARLAGTVILGALVGICAGKGAAAGKVGSRPAYLILGFVSGLSAVYFSWVLWIFVVSHYRLLTFSPTTIYRIARGVLAFLTWNIHGKQIKGPPLVCGWIAEATIITSLATLVCRDGMKKFFCCPVCHARFRSAAGTRHYAIPENVGEVSARLRDFDFTCLSGLTEVEMDEADSYLTLELYVCPTCSSFGFLDLESLELWTSGNDVISRRATLLDHVVIPPDKLQGLLTLKEGSHG
jgi:hypothetical protein